LHPGKKKFKSGNIVIGGIITGAFDKFGNYLLQSLSNHHVNAGVSLSILRENAAIIGSARLIDNAFFAKVEPLLSKM